MRNCESEWVKREKEKGDGMEEREVVLDVSRSWLMRHTDI